MALLQEEANVIKNFMNNDLVQLLVAEANRLPAPYGGSIAAVIGAVGPMLVEFVAKKIDEIGAPAAVGAPAVAAPVAPVIAPQG